MMDDQKILDNAPKNKNHYFQLFGECKGANDGYINNSVGICRSLADIKELVELRKANAELVTQNQRLKVIITERESVIDNLRSVKSEMEGERYLKDKWIAELEKRLIAPTDSGINELDYICEVFNSSEKSNLTSLVSLIWNKSHFVALKAGN
jgi:predicted nuclease with TOPRIM domain